MFKQPKQCVAEVNRDRKQRRLAPFVLQWDETEMDPCNRSMSTVGFQDKHARTPLLPTRGPIDPTIFSGTSIDSTCLLASLDIITAVDALTAVT